jgi:cyclase
MLTKRIIPCLDIKDGRTVKGVNFIDLRDAGDPVELAALYSDQGADELVFLDITATVEKRSTLVRLVDAIAHRISIPFTVGGGISAMADVEAVLAAGADKVTINSAALRNPGIIDEVAARFGSQCLVLAVDTRCDNDEWVVYSHGGRYPTEHKTLTWVKEVEGRGAGEILLTSMNHDGTKKGFALDLTREVSELLRIPVIASGGAGSKAHFTDIFTHGKADAALAASIFHFGEIGLQELKIYLFEQKVTVRYEN